MSLGLLSLPLCLTLAVPTQVDVAAAGLLHHWDGRRAHAWSAGDQQALVDLYTAGSPTGRADRAMLRTWAERELRVEGLRTQLLSVRVRRWSGGHLVLTVTDRLAAGVAVGRGLRVPLPHDTATTRTVRLRRVAGEWLVASVS